MILEIWPILTFWSMLTFWLMFTSKLVAGLIWLPGMQMLFKFQVNWMKIDNFRNSAYVDILADVDFDNNWWLN